MPELAVGYVGVEQFLKGLHGTHELWARQYMVQKSEGVNDTAPVFFVLAVPKGVGVGPGLINKLAGDIVSSLVEAASAGR